MQRQLSLTKNQLRDLRLSNDTTQAKLLDHSQRQGNQNSDPHFPSDIYDLFPDDEVVSKLAEVDMIVADLERANSRVAALERRNVGHILLSKEKPPHLPDSQEILRAETEAMRGGSESSER